jgi:uncharacterized protein
MTRLKTCVLILLLSFAAVASAQDKDSSELVIGRTIRLDSVALSEVRVINAFVPSGYENERLPVIYMLDGGIKEDFLHIAGLVQVGVSNGTVAPHILIGIENTQRRRDLTGETNDPKDKAIAPVVGGSKAFRRFLKDELIPFVNSNFSTNSQKVIVGESLAGLFVLETLKDDPALFNHYIAVDPSVWWNQGGLVKDWKLDVSAVKGLKVYVALSKDTVSSPATEELKKLFRDARPEHVVATVQDFPNESHLTIFHPAALDAFRNMLKPSPAP